MLATGAAALWAQDEEVVQPPAVRDLGEPPEAAPPLRTNDADISKILADRPTVPVSTPVNAKPKATKAALPVEGSTVKNRRCRMEAVPKSHWQKLTFLDGDALPRLALPCRYLETMERIAEKQPQATFVVSGESFNYSGQAYLLLQKVLVESEAVAPASQVSTDLAPPSRPTTASQTSGNRVDAMVSDLLGPLRKPVLEPIDQPQTQNAPSVAPAGDVELVAEENTYVSDRLARIVLEPGTDWYVACLEGDNTLQEPPYRILPCHLLEQAVKTAAEINAAPDKAADGLALTPKLPGSPRTKVKQVTIPGTVRCSISGEIKTYQGRKYLVLRKRLADRDMGQF